MSNQNTSSVIFVCWGNICRSPMAEFVARKVFSDEGLDARITSAGVSDEEHGGPMDSRARSTTLTRSTSPRSCPPTSS